MALEYNGSRPSPCVHRTYTPLQCACWPQWTTGTALGCERGPLQSHPVPAHWRTKNLCDEETRGTEPSVTWKGLATGVTGDKKVEASGIFEVQGHPYSPPEAPCVQTGRQAGQVLRARDNEQRLCNQEQKRMPKTQPHSHAAAAIQRTGWRGTAQAPCSPEHISTAPQRNCTGSH